MHVPWITIDPVTVGDGTVSLPIVVYIDGSFIKNRIAVKSKYITLLRLRSLSSTLSGKSFAWLVLGMLPALKKKPIVAQSNAWRAQRRLRLHRVCMKNVVPVDSVNRVCSADTHVLCADGKAISESEISVRIPYINNSFYGRRCDCPGCAAAAAEAV